MDLNYLTNITKINYEEEIKKAIEKVNNKYKNLTKEQTCFLYSSFIYEELKNKHIISRIISTKDLGIDYEHRFVLVKEIDKYFIIDLTYNQFFNKIPDKFYELSNNGYQVVSKGQIKEYIMSFTGIEIDKNVDKLFYK